MVESATLGKAERRKRRAQDLRRGLSKSRSDAGLTAEKVSPGWRWAEPWGQWSLTHSFDLLVVLGCKPLLSPSFLKHLQLKAGLC